MGGVGCNFVVGSVGENFGMGQKRSTNVLLFNNTTQKRLRLL